jgi:hypothetical protein
MQDSSSTAWFHANELLDSLQYPHFVIVSGDTLRHIIWDMKLVKSIVRTPMEAEKKSFDPGEIDC